MNSLLYHDCLCGVCVYLKDLTRGRLPDFESQIGLLSIADRLTRDSRTTGVHVSLVKFVSVANLALILTL